VERLKDLTSDEKSDIIKIYDEFIRSNGLKIKKNPLKNIKPKVKCNNLSNHKMVKFFNIPESSFHYEHNTNSIKNTNYIMKEKNVFDTFNSIGNVLVLKN
jgi:hypothetical protein